MFLMAMEQHIPNYGMIMANGILNANPIPAGEQRNQIIIVFTDGIRDELGGMAMLLMLLLLKLTLLKVIMLKCIQ